MHTPENLPPADNLGQMVGQHGSTPWRHFVLPPDPPVTRIQLALLKTGLHAFRFVVFNQAGALAHVGHKRA